MRKALRISAAALTVVSLSMIAARPLVAGLRIPAEQSAAAVSINPFQLMEQATDLPVQQIEDFSMIY